jgi:recombination protein RecA
VDSVAALVPKAEIEGDMGDAHVGLQARLMSQALRKLTGAVSKSNTIVIFINQLREKVGVMFGNPETTPGGKALKFYASVRLDVRRVDALKNGTDIIGNRTRVKVVKNKVAPPFKSAEFDMLYGEGISKEGAILDLAVDRKLLQKSGAWYNYGEMRIAQGRDNTRIFLKDNPELTQKLEKQLRAMFDEERKQAIADQEAKRRANQSAMAAAEAAQNATAKPAVAPSARPAPVVKAAPAPAARKPIDEDVEPE